MSEVTQLLQAIDQGDPLAASQLLPLVYNELRRLAHRKLANEPAGHTLEATALVHEAYLRLLGDDADQHWDHGGHFFAAAATAMRRILVERARHKNRAVHGGGRRRQELHADFIAAPKPDEDLLALDEALCQLVSRDPITARLGELRYFAGLTGDQAAELLGISPSTADRHWTFARVKKLCSTKPWQAGRHFKCRTKIVEKSKKMRTPSCQLFSPVVDYTLSRWCVVAPLMGDGVSIPPAGFFCAHVRYPQLVR
jgi:RNA polymerase sigma factor (TIGR02999 family)